MNKYLAYVSLIVSLLIVTSPSQGTGVFRDSIFERGRYPISHLDLDLHRAEKWWQEYFIDNPTLDTKRKFPLITKAGVRIELRYSGGDHINASGVIFDHNGFVKLSSNDRRLLVKKTLKALKTTLLMTLALVDKNTGLPTGKIVENQHFRLGMRFNDVWENDRNENICLPLSRYIERLVGCQAGYGDGKFIFSEPYFLNLEIQNGVAKSGDGNRFVIENDTGGT